MASRSQLLALVEADQPTADRVRELLPTSQATERRRQLDLLQRGAPDAYGRRGLELVLGHIASVETGSFPEVSQIVDVAVALRDPRVRNSVLATALSEHAHVAETLWAYLTRTLPGHDRAGAATLLGYSAYVRGNGPLAGIALRAALDADPEHPMALLLEIALQIGIHPRKVRELARSGAEEAAALGIPIEIDPGAR